MRDQENSSCKSPVENIKLNIINVPTLTYNYVDVIHNLITKRVAARSMKS